MAKKNQTAQKLAITLIKSGSGRLPKHTATLTGLGLRRINQTVVLEDTACIRGMINQISYLLKVEPSEQ
jgi:large subunit ribosomal protein L30